MDVNWEYLVVNMSIVDGTCEYVTGDKKSATPKYEKELLNKDEQEVLTYLGDLGWDLVNIFQGRVWFDGGEMIAKSLYFKRPKY